MAPQLREAVCNTYMIKEPSYMDPLRISGTGVFWRSHPFVASIPRDLAFARQVRRT